MPTPPDLDNRLRRASGPEPDTERALSHVMTMIRRRALRRRIIAVAAAIIVLGVPAAVWAVQRQGSDQSSIVAGEPPTAGELELRELWSTEGVGPTGEFPASNGRLTLSTGDLVLTAEGHGPGQTEPAGRITALEHENGNVRWTAELGESAFLQGAAGGTVIANTQYERIIGLDIADGSVRWEISLAELGLDDYGAVVSAATEPLSAIGVSANVEGDVRPPVILGVNPSTGEVVWRTDLVEGTDLQWGNPPVSDGEAVFTSTLSHPGSAEENVAHLVELADGSIRWTVGMGGGQAFTERPAVIEASNVHLPAHPEVLTVNRADGNPRWHRPAYWPVMAGGQLWMLGADGALETVDPATGDLIGRVDSGVDEPGRLLDMGGGLVGVVGHGELAIVDSDGSVRLTHTSPTVSQFPRIAVVDAVLFDRGMLVIATEDQTVTAYALETTDG